MFKNIPQERMILYIIALGLLPMILVGINFFANNSQLENTSNHLQYVYDLAVARERKEAMNQIVQEHYKAGDHFYIDKNLETLSFLDPEIEMLQKLVNNKYYAGDENVKKRLEFLTGPSNKMLFSEGNVENFPSFQETTASLVHPIEINDKNLQEILSIIEGLKIGSFKPLSQQPQLIILDFKLDKKEVYSKNDVFLLNLKLLKREFL
jgi:hypothetical protein